MKLFYKINVKNYISMDGWNGYSIAAVILVIIAIIMIIVGIVWLEDRNPASTLLGADQSTNWGWGLIIGGIILLIIGIIVGFVGRRSATSTVSSTHMSHTVLPYGHPAVYPQHGPYMGALPPPPLVHYGSVDYHSVPATFAPPPMSY
jgi:hypothetical protein